MPDIERSQEPRFDIDRMELRGFTRSVAEVEWLLIILALLFLRLTNVSVERQNVYVGSLVVFAVLVIVFRYTPLFRGRPRLGLEIETLLMVAFVTAIAMQTGYTSSPLFNLYLLPIITSALTLGRRTTILHVAAVCVCYVWLSVMGAAHNVWSLSFLGHFVTVMSPILLVALLTTLLASNIRSTKDHIRDLSDKDGLTGLYNLRAFTRSLNAEHAKARRLNSVYGILMIDVDNLKPINDEFGHEGGNKALVLVAGTVARNTRASDVAARYGGDEFVILLPDSDPATANQVARRIRNGVYGNTLNVGPKMVRVSVSIGLASYPDDGPEIANVMLAADERMYADKSFRRRKDASGIPGSVNAG